MLDNLNALAGIVASVVAIIGGVAGWKMLRPSPLKIKAETFFAMVETSYIECTFTNTGTQSLTITEVGFDFDPPLNVIEFDVSEAHDAFIPDGGKLTIETRFKDAKEHFKGEAVLLVQPREAVPLRARLARTKRGRVWAKCTISGKKSWSNWTEVPDMSGWVSRRLEGSKIVRRKA